MSPPYKLQRKIYRVANTRMVQYESTFDIIMDLTYFNEELSCHSVPAQQRDQSDDRDGSGTDLDGHNGEGYRLGCLLRY